MEFLGLPFLPFFLSLSRCGLRLRGFNEAAAATGMGKRCLLVGDGFRYMGILLVSMILCVGLAL